MPGFVHPTHHDVSGAADIYKQIQAELSKAMLLNLLRKLGVKV